MNILALYPGLNPSVNDVAFALNYIADELSHNITVITARESQTKAVTDSPKYEEIGNLHIHRPYKSYTQMIWYPQMQSAAVKQVAAEVNPDVIICSQEYNMRLARYMQQSCERLSTKQGAGKKIPIVLITEFAGRLADGTIPGKLLPTVMPMLGVPMWGKAYWRWLRKHASEIITYDAADIDRLEQLSAGGTKVTYVPWCNQLPPDFEKPAERHKRMFYIGSFSAYKNTDSLAWVVPQVLEETETEEVLLIGPGDTQVVNDLIAKYGKKIQYKPGCSRMEALVYCASSYFAFTPLNISFGGLLGDSWAVGTPVVSTPGSTKLEDSVNALIPPTQDEMGKTVQRLYSEPDLYRQLQAGGDSYYQQRSASAVGSQIVAVLERAIQRAAIAEPAHIV